jgi:hypothetical protein
MWAYLWIAWLVAFIIIETWSVLSKDTGPTTLSEHIWQWFDIKGTSTAPWAIARRWIMRAFLIFLTLHLGWGWFF